MTNFSRYTKREIAPHLYFVRDSDEHWYALLGVVGKYNGWEILTLNEKNGNATALVINDEGNIRNFKVLVPRYPALLYIKLERVVVDRNKSTALKLIQKEINMDIKLLGEYYEQRKGC